MSQLPDVGETGQSQSIDADRTVRNGLANAFASAFVALASLGGSVVVVRSLGSGEYGALSYYLWLASVLTTLGTLAFPRAITKVVSELRGQDREVETAALFRWVNHRVTLVNVALSLGLLCIAATMAEPERLYLIVVALVPVPYGLMTIIRSTLWGHERYAPVAVTDIITAFLQFAAIVVAAALAWGVLGFLAGALSGYFVAAGGMAIAARRTLRSRISANGPASALSSSARSTYLALLLPASLVVLYEAIVWQRSEIFFLARMASLEEVGYYNLAFTVFSTLLLVGWALLHSFYPAIARSHGGGDWGRVRRLVHDGSIVAAIFAVPLTFGGWAVIQQVTVLLYTDKMLPIVPVAQVLLVGLLPGSLAFLLSAMATAVGGIWWQVRVGLLVVVLNLVLDVALIPRLGAVGAATASTTAQWIYSLGMLAVASRRFHVMIAWGVIGRIVVLGIVATLILPLAVQNIVPGPAGIVAAISLAAAAYAIGLQAMGYGRWVARAFGPVLRSVRRGRVT